jgi:hypothetical protein
MSISKRVKYSDPWFSEYSQADLRVYIILEQMMVKRFCQFFGAIFAGYIYPYHYLTIRSTSATTRVMKINKQG